ncbi:MAG: hypothetical protein A2107_13630 [Verrucomicrobia bacterium GWF2_62_7]|nr:MAG: hypothetical protein A2107_13630 [Verrucomicrobia bacterium GWF2_62_7]
MEADTFRARWSGRGAAVAVERAHNWAGARAGLRPGGVPAEQFPCHTPWASMVILHDGTVPLCCLDYDAKCKLGDLKSQGIVEIWRGPELARLRKDHLERDYRAYPLCANCSYTFDQPHPQWWFPARPAMK